MNSPIPPSSPGPDRIGPQALNTRIVQGSGTGIPPVPLSTDELGTIPLAPNELAPPPLSATQLPPPPSISKQLERLGARVDAIEGFGLSRDAARLLLGEVDERHPL